MCGPLIYLNGATSVNYSKSPYKNENVLASIFHMIYVPASSIAQNKVRPTFFL